MQRNTLYILILCLFAAIGLIWLLQQTPASREPLALPLGQLQRGNIKQVEVADSHGTIATLRLNNGLWDETVSGYPADNLKIERLLDLLFSLKVLETKTSRADLYNRLGVERIDQPAARGIQLRIGDASSASYTMTFGDLTSNGQYMRPNDESTTLLIAPAIEIPIDRIEWLERGLLNIPATELTGIKLQPADDQLVELVKLEPDQPRFTLLNIPQNRELATPDAANSIAGILSELQLESVRQIASIELDEPELTGEFFTRDGAIIQVAAFTAKDGMYFSFNILRESAQVDANLAARLQGWAYTLPTFKRNQFLTRMDDLLK
jgi:hypothetical protein